jgi:diguanylate cyclase (GGDEF)-like protein
MHFSLPIFLVVLLLGVLQLAVGVMFGRCLPVRPTNPAPPGDEPGEAAAGHALRLASQLCELVTRVTRDVGDHQTQLQQINQELAACRSSDTDRLAGLVVRPAGQLLQLNGRLQARLSAAEEKLKQQTAEIQSHIAAARTDPLTKLSNRRAIDAALACRIAQWQQTAVPLHLMVIDVDQFQRLNDQHGHLAGDQALRKIADVLRRMLPETDLIARLRDAEFAVILPGSNTGDARRLWEAVRTAVGAADFCFEKSRFPLTVSVGVASVQAGDDRVSLVRRAEEALSAAKRAGRNAALFHNGQTCQPIQLADQPENELQEICFDLRQRVAQLTDAS